MISSIGSMNTNAVSGSRPPGPPPPRPEEKFKELDTDSSGSLEVGEMPEPPRGGAQGPPPFLADDGSVQDYSSVNRNFNPLESLMSYLSAGAGEASSSQWNLEA